jgi:hypothetical protein
MSKFCPECGTRLSEPNPKFCPECGANLGHQEARPVDTAKAIPPPPSPDARPSVHEDVEMRKVNAYELGQRLEQMAASIFKNLGYSVEVRKKVQTRTGSVCEFDVLLRRGQRTMAIECKNYDVSRAVGIQDLHVFRDKLVQSDIYSGIFITNTTFSEDAVKLATDTDTNIDLWDGAELRERYTATALGRLGTGVDEHTVLPLATDFSTATSLPLKNRHVVQLFNPMLVYHPYIQVSYRLQARRKDGARKTHRFSDSGTYFVDALEGDIINRDKGMMVSIGDIFKGKEARLSSKEDRMVAEDLKGLPSTTKAVLSTTEYKTVVEKSSFTIEEAAETVRSYAMKKNTQDVSYEKKIKGESVTRTFRFTPEAGEISICGTKMIHAPQWNMTFEAGRSIFSRRILASSNRVLADGLAMCSVCTLLKKQSVVVCEECGRPLCEKHSYLEGRWLCQDHISNALREQIKSRGIFSRIKAGLGQ